MLRRTLVLAVLSLALAATPALAAKGGPKPGPSTASIALDQPQPQAGDVVTFTVSYPAMREDPRVRVLCHQDGTLVYQYSSAPSTGFHLWSMLWQGGAAECAADLYYYTYQGRAQTGVVYLAHTDFTVAG